MALGFYIFDSLADRAFANCTIHLKDGRVIEASYCEETESTFYYHKYGSKIGIAREKVKSFSFEETEMADVDEQEIKHAGTNASEKEIYIRTGRNGRNKTLLTGYLKELKLKYNKMFNKGEELHLILSNGDSKLREEERLLLMLDYEESKLASANEFKEKYEYSLSVEPEQAHFYKRDYDRRMFKYFLIQLAIKKIIERNPSNPEVKNIVSSFTEYQSDNYNNAGIYLSNLANSSEYVNTNEFEKYL